MTKEEPFSATFKQEKETKNTVRYSEESEDRRPVVGTVYFDKYEPRPVSIPTQRSVAKALSRADSGND